MKKKHLGLGKTMTKLLLGIENSCSYQSMIKNKQIGLITNYTGMTSDFIPNYYILNQYGHVKKIFTPEHGLHGIAQAGTHIASYFDKKLLVNIISLYGENRAPKKEDLEDLEVLIFDIQDVGVRYYTYIYTMFNSMKIAEKLGLPFIVMDRPLPLGRNEPIGNILTKDFFSFVGLLPITNYYSLTIGELALWIQEKYYPTLDLKVSTMSNWNSQQDICNNKSILIPPSPNLPNLDSIRLYIGLCFLEGTNVSEGRGTIYPFQQFGAPWINGELLAKNLKRRIPEEDILFQPTYFKPLTSKYENQVCEGVRIHVINPNVNGLKLGCVVLDTLYLLYPNEFNYSLISEDIGNQHTFLEYLTGVNIDDHKPFATLNEELTNSNDIFKKQIEKFYLY